MRTRTARTALIATTLTLLTTIFSPLAAAAAVAATMAATAAAVTAGPALAQTTTAPAPSAVPSDTIPVYLDGLPVEFDVPPTIINGRTLVPFRLLAEALGCEVLWDQNERHVHATAPWSGRTVDLWIERTDALVSGQARTLDVPAMIIGGRTLIPLRFFGEALGAEVLWHNDTRSITVASPARPMEVLGYYALGNAETSSWTEVFGRSYPDSGVGATDVISTAACAWFVLDPATGGIVLNDSYSGQKRPNEWQDIVARLGDYAIQADMMVHWARTDPATGVVDPSIYAFLRDPAAMRRAVEEIAGYAADFHGVNLDIEYLGQRQSGDELAATRRDFNTFVGLLAEVLHAQGKTLTLSLHPLNSWYPGYDWETLGAYADRIVIMAYGYGSLTSPQPLDKVAGAIDLALKVVPREKLLLGLLATKSNGTYGGETAETLAVKVGLAKRRGLAGVALWRLGVWGPDRLGAIRALVSRPAAAEVVLDLGPRLEPVDTTATPPIEVGGTYYVPLLPVADCLGIPVRWDEAAGQAIVTLRAYGLWDEPVTPVPADQVTFDPAQAPEAILLRGMTYLRVDYAVSLLGQFAPEDASYSVEVRWDPDAPAGPRLTLERIPRFS